MKALPPDSATYRAVGGDWTQETELLATQAELLHSFMRIWISANSKPNARLPEPLQIPRPWGTQETKRAGTSMAELRALIQDNGAVTKGV